MNELTMRLILSQMALEGMPASTVTFYSLIYPFLKRNRKSSCKKMSEAAFVSTNYARKHVKRLEEAGYLNRLNYFSWELIEDPFRDDQLRFMNKLVISQFPAYRMKRSAA